MSSELNGNARAMLADKNFVMVSEMCMAATGWSHVILPKVFLEKLVIRSDKVHRDTLMFWICLVLC
jgi:hypothetical protein